MSDDLPLIVKRCLAHGVKIYPYQLFNILDQYKRKAVPDDVLEKMDANKLNEYICGLYYSGCESAGDWTKGHEILCRLGFEKVERSEGHRSFVSLTWKDAT